MVQIKLILLLLIPLCAPALSSELTDDIIQDAIRQSKETPFAPEKICYGELGCFDINWECMKQFSKLPFSPEKMATQFYAFTPKVAKGAQTPAAIRVHYNNLTTLAEIPEKASIAIVVHGFGNNGRGDEFIRMKEALRLRYSVVINVDW